MLLLPFHHLHFKVARHSMPKSTNESTDYRRLMILVCSIVLLTVYAIIVLQEGQTGDYKMLANACGRIGLVMGVLWIAWPNLQRPINWLPPGIAVAGVIAIGMIAARPHLALVAVPALGTLLAITTIIRRLKP